MIIFELDDFDYWVDNSVADSIYVFSPMFVYLVHWASEEGYLSEEFSSCSLFQEAFVKLQRGEMQFPQFVYDILDGKFLDSYLKPELQQFVKDYFEYDGYSEDLVACFNANLWQLPMDLLGSKKMMSFINSSLINYRRNLSRNPDIINFDS